MTEKDLTLVSVALFIANILSIEDSTTETSSVGAKFTGTISKAEIEEDNKIDNIDEFD